MFSGTLWGDWLLKKFSMFSALFDFERKTFGPQAKFFVNLVKTVFFISGGTVGRKTHFLKKKKRIFRYFWTFTEFFIDLRQNLFPWGCESSTLRIQRNNLWMKFFLTLIGHWANRIRPSEKQLTQVSQNCFLRVQSNIFGEHCFFEKKFFLSNLGICGKVSGLWQKVLSSVFQTALCVSTTTFSDFLASFRFSGTFDFWIIFYSISSRTLSMLLSYCSVKHFDVKHFETKDLTYSNSEQLFSINCVKQSRAGLSKLNSACPI